MHDMKIFDIWNNTIDIFSLGKIPAEMVPPQHRLSEDEIFGHHIL